MMGLVHSGATICDLVRPSFLMPLDVNLLALMADAPIGLTSRTAVLPTYLGFSFSHGLGMCILGLVAILIAARDFGLVLRFRSLLPLLILASLFYITISITFWFYAPALSSGIACGCFLLSYLTVSLEGTRN